jgi:hypothetical protein
MGTGQMLLPHSELKLHPDIRKIKVRTHQKCFITGFEFLNSKGDTLSKCSIWDKGVWKEHKLRKNERLTGVFGNAIMDNALASFGFVTTKMYKDDE